MEEEYAAVGMVGGEGAYHLLHLFYRINLALVCCERCDAYPALEILLLTDCFGQEAYISLSFTVNAVEGRFKGESEAFDDVGVVLE